MTVHRLTALLLWIITNWPTAVATGEVIATLDGVNVSAVVKLEAELPCDISPPSDDDKPHLIFWYREMSGSPFYSLDVRDKPLDSAKHMIGDELRSRMVFRTQREPASLLIHEVEPADEGSYRCRVDFRSSPTRYFVVNLTVIIPPSVPSILDERGLELGQTVGPYNEGSSLFISCEAKEGRPPPMVTWWRENTLIDDNFEVTSLGIVRNDLVVSSLERSDFHASFTCQASNTNLTAPVATAVTVDMNLKPLDVKIREPRRSLSAGRRYKLECRSFGSRPLPIMAWWMGDQRLKNTEETTSNDGNVTTSVLTFVPTSADNGKHLSCRAENPAILKSGIEDGWTLDIYFLPIVTLELGGSLKNDSIREGDDVYFECRISANPFVHAVDWKFQTKYLVNNSTSGVIISNQSLVIQSVRRDNVGPYSCVAINTEGEGESNVFHLHVRHIPVCKVGQKKTYGVARNEAARIVCEVDAYPSKVSFRWAFNRTSDNVNSSRARSISESTRSTLMYIPRSEQDFGTLFCWGTNEMGSQAEPCVYHVIAAGLPDPVNNCTVYNQTESSFYVECRAGYNGGLSQHFVLDIYDAQTRELKSMLTSPRPLFYVSGLQPGSRFSVSVCAANSKGRSESTDLPASTLSAPHVEDKGDLFSMTPILGVMIGIVAALSMVAIAIVVIMRCRATQNIKRRDFEREQAERSNIPLRKDVDEGGDTEEKSPDVIPSSNGKEVPSYMSFPFATVDQEFPPVEVKCLQKQQTYANHPQVEHSVHRQTPPPPSSTVVGNSYDVQQPNHTGTWGSSHKVKPYEDVSYLEMQTPAHHLPQRKPLPPQRRPPDPGEVVGWRGSRLPYSQGDEEDAETPLMNQLPDHSSMQKPVDAPSSETKTRMEMTQF